MGTADAQPASLPPNSRWCRLTPDRLMAAWMLLEGFLFLSQRWQWLPLNRAKGYTVLIALAAVAAAFSILLLWFLLSCLFRWRFQFGIRSLLIFTTAVALVCGWFASELRMAKKQERIVKAIAKARGCVMYDGSQGASEYTSPVCEGCWERLLGYDFFHNVVEVGDNPNGPSGGDLTEHVAELPWEPVTRLLFWGHHLTDERVRCLARFTNARDVRLSPGHKITDAGLTWLHTLAEVRKLDISYVLLSDESVNELKDLKHLEHLELGRTEITDAGLASIEGLNSLRDLDLCGCFRLTDAGMVSLGRMTGLQTLSLICTEITDAGLEHLGRLVQLEVLELGPENVTAAGVAKLRRRLPCCDIRWFLPSPTGEKP